MFQIKTKNTKSLKPSNWLRIGDLSNFEGPILTLFQDLESNHLFLYDWVDRDKTHNRWMIYTVAPEKLLRFLNKEISHFDLFQQRPTEAVYVADMDNRGMNFSQYPILELKEVPEEYVPSTENYFEEGDCVGEERIRLVVLREINVQQNKALFRGQGGALKASMDPENESAEYAFFVVSEHTRGKLSTYMLAVNDRKYLKSHNSIGKSDLSYSTRNTNKSKAINSKVYANPID